MLNHGGKLGQAQAQYGIPLSDWLDLSTGISPRGWRVPEVPARAWARLPEDDDELEQTARRYYNAASLLPVAGSQAAIQTLPRLRRRCRVGVVSPTYNEHAHAWRLNGHDVVELNRDDISAQLDTLDVLVLVNPNNPTGDIVARQQCVLWHERLAARGAWLIVDEAFMDATPQNSIAEYAHLPGLIVLRSIGKFFGLAGARAGFVLAAAPLLQQLQSLIGPWALSGATRYVVGHALADTDWQTSTRRSLLADGTRLQSLLLQNGIVPSGGTAYFQWVKTPSAFDIYEQLARQGILIRYWGEPGSVRFGLPGTQAQWQRLSTALASLRVNAA